jgi:hypothetical protein
LTTKFTRHTQESF